jgi:pimeloyl-ACP methyl ester carboxylesterase
VRWTLIIRPANPRRAKALRHYLHLEQAVMLGHSWGGLLVTEFAVRHPERVSRLILFNFSPASHNAAQCSSGSAMP